MYRRELRRARALARRRVLAAELPRTLKVRLDTRIPTVVSSHVA